MNDSFASWMIAGGPRHDEHDQRILSHLAAIREMREVARADHRTLVERIRSRVAVRTQTEQIDCPA